MKPTEWMGLMCFCVVGVEAQYRVRDTYASVYNCLFHICDNYHPTSPTPTTSRWDYPTRPTHTTSSTTRRTTPVVTTTTLSKTTTTRVTTPTITVTAATPTTPTTTPGCASGQFQCKNGKCIPQAQVCDSNPDCPPDHEDELNCPGAPCSEGFIRCADGHCYPSNKRCDTV